MSSGPNNVGVRFDDELFELLSKRCEERGIPKSAFLRELADKELNPKPPTNYRKWEYLVSKWDQIVWGSPIRWIKELGNEIIDEAQYLLKDNDTDYSAKRLIKCPNCGTHWHSAMYNWCPKCEFEKPKIDTCKKCGAKRQADLFVKCPICGSEEVI